VGRGRGGTGNHGNPTVWPRPKVWTRDQRAGEVHMRNNPGGELDPVEGVRRRCKNYYLLLPSYLSCIGKRTREGCDHGGEGGTVHSGRDGEGTVTPRKPKESGRRGRCEKI